jgi:hypothetical protein
VAARRLKMTLRGSRGGVAAEDAPYCTLPRTKLPRIVVDSIRGLVRTQEQIVRRRNTTTS